MSKAPAKKSSAPARGRAPAKRRTVHTQARTQARDVYRTSILEAAERVFARRGWAAVKVADIAREAGLAAGTLYNYFDSKERILESIIEWRSGQVFEQVTAIARGSGSPLARMREYTRWMFQHLETDGVSVRIFAEASGGLPLKPGQRCFADNYQRHLELTRELIGAAQDAGELRDDLSVDDLTMALSGIVTGHINDWMHSPNRGALVPRVERLYDLFLKGAASR